GRYIGPVYRLGRREG
nr:ribosomal 30S protein TS4 {N-terminal} [Thermus thermophilus, Peptide Partial, 15 aa] [Thermus thermophilus]